MRSIGPSILMLAFVLFLSGTCAGEEALPKWPEIGSRWELERTHAAVAAERLGTSYWEKPPAVISSSDANYFDYRAIVWGGDDRLPNSVDYSKALRKMYVCGAMNYSDENPAGWAKARMPFYCTNLCNQLYLRNKPAGKSIMAAFNKARTRENCVRMPSLEDPSTDSSEQSKAAAIARACGPQKPLGYDLRDEGTYAISAANPHDFDFSNVSLSAFRLWLKAKYGSLEALNKEWETAYASWDAVFPLMSDEIQAREFKRIPKANFAPWADHREYNDDTMMAAVSRYRDAIRKQDPGAGVGYSGTQMPSAWGGFDFWKISNVLGWIEYYDCNGSRELLRSFMPRHYPAIAAVPFTSADDGLRKMWYMVLHGDVGGLVWPYDGHDSSRTLLLEAKDGQIVLSPKGENLKSIFKEARGGIPCLLNHADPLVDPIGVLHSQASLRADWIFEVKRDGKSWHNRYSSFEGAHNYAAAGREGCFKLLEDVGLQYSCFSDEQVTRGELLKRGVKLFLIPRGLALSKKTVEALTAYVEAGGVLVTDLMAGRMNENCRVWTEETGPLDVLLGLKRAPFAFEEEKKEEHEKGGYAGGFGRTLEVSMEADFGGFKSGEKFAIQGFQEPGLQAGTAKALAKTPSGPALLEQPRGKGFAYTLNFDLPNYLRDRADKEGSRITAPVRRLMESLAKKAGIEPAVKVRIKNTQEHPLGLETFRYKLGDAEICAVHLNGSVRINWEDLSDSGASVTVAAGLDLSIQLPKKGYVTEMRTGKSFGLVDTVEIKTLKDRPIILCVLPYEVKALKADFGAGKLEGGKLPVDIALDLEGAAQDHVVHAELVDEHGVPVPESAVNLPLPKGRYKGAIDLSFVPGAGPWTLKLTDLASGKMAEVNVSK